MLNIYCIRKSVPRYFKVDRLWSDTNELNIFQVSEKVSWKNAQNGVENLKFSVQNLIWRQNPSYTTITE